MLPTYVTDDLAASGITPEIFPTLSSAYLEDLFLPFSEETAIRLYPKQNNSKCSTLQDTNGTWKTTKGYFIRYPNVENYYNFKNLDPTWTETDDEGVTKIVKYRLKSGSSVHLFIHPDQWKLRTKTKDISFLWIEGEKKGVFTFESLKHFQRHHNILVMASSGVGNFIPTPEFAECMPHFKGHDHYFLFDADAFKNKLVAQSELKLAMALLTLGVDINRMHAIVWNGDEGKGFDDWCVFDLKTVFDRFISIFDQDKLSPWQKYASFDETILFHGIGSIVRYYDRLPHLSNRTLTNLADHLSKCLPHTKTTLKADITQELRDAVNTIADQPPDDTEHEGKRILYLGSYTDVSKNLLDVPKIAEEAWMILAANNDPPQYFLYDGNPCIAKNHKERLYPVVFNEESFKATLYHHISWQIAVKDIGWRVREAHSGVIRHMLNDHEFMPPLPELESVTYNPYFTKDGTLITKHGYNPDTKIYQAGPELSITISDTPSYDDAIQAKQLLEEFFQDFQFERASDKAHAYCLLFELFIRSWFPYTPMYCVEAPRPASGKSKLIDNICYIAHGEIPAHMSEQPEEEWGKVLALKLQKMPQLIYIDNLRQPLNSSWLMNALTAHKIENRLITTASLPELKNTPSWIITGNNPHIFPELRRRTVRIRLNTKEAQPEYIPSSKFRHYPLEPWVRASRNKLMHAALTIIKYWVVQGKQQGTLTLASFEEWSGIMGGILHAVNIEGFLNSGQVLHHDFGHQPQTIAEKFQQREPGEDLEEAPNHNVVPGPPPQQATFLIEPQDVEKDLDDTFLPKQYQSR